MNTPTGVNAANPHLFIARAGAIHTPAASVTWNCRNQRKLSGVDNTEEFRCISLCTGYAGIELGLREVVPNLRTVAYVEVEAFACANLVSKIEAGKLDAAPIWTDIKTFDGRPFHKRVHIITAGYPCQGESHAGKRKGAADPRWLWPYIERIIQAVRPVWFFGENVSGHLSLGFPEVYRSLRLMGYSVEAGLFTAAECGASHRRERLFILAYNTRSGFQDVQIQQKGQSSLGAYSKDLVHAAAQGLQKSRTRRFKKAQFAAQFRWPARPGQPQHEWEEPRVVGNTKFRSRPKGGGKCEKHRSIGQAACITSPSEKRSGKYAKGQQKAKSRLGRAANGPGSRVDRLRLLGNGVVPQCAERAFRELSNENRSD